MTPSKKRNRAYTKQERRQVSFNPIDNPEDRELLEYVDQPWFNFSGTVKSLLRHHLLGEPLTLNIPFMNEVVPSKPIQKPIQDKPKPEPTRQPEPVRQPEPQPEPEPQPQPIKQVKPEPKPEIPVKPEPPKPKPNKPKKNVGQGMPGMF